MDLAPLLEHLPVGVFAADHEARVVPANAEARRYLTLFDPNVHPVVQGLIRDALRGDDSDEVALLEQGCNLTITARGIRQADGSPPRVVLTVQNAPPRAVPEEDDRLAQAVVDRAADPIFVKDRAFRFVLVSASLCELVGRTRGEMLGRTDYDFFPEKQADFFRAKDEEMFRRESRVAIEEEPITSADGRTRVLATTKVPIRNRHGVVTHLLGAIHDITELKQAQADLSTMNRALAAEVAEKTHAVQRLAHANAELAAFTDTVSHDLRAPLTSIGAFTELVLADGDLRPDARSRDYLRRVTAAVERMARLVDDLLGFSEAARSVLNRTPLDLATIAQDVVAELRRADPTRAVDVRVDAPLDTVGDPRLLRLVLENVIGNAWKFTSRSPTPRISMGQGPAGTGSFFVADNGVGFASEQSSRVFEPFQRMHPREEFPGTGLGLASVRRIVERHGGRVWVESALGVGTTLWFTLPS